VIASLSLALVFGMSTATSQAVVSYCGIEVLA